MAILRHHHEKEFTIVPNSLITDQELNLRDIGMLCYLLHLPDDWDFSIKGLTSVLPRDGRDGIAASLKRIEQAGYLHREQERDKNGKLGDYIWIVSDAPLPKTEKPNTAEPNTVNPTQTKNIYNKEKTEESTQAISSKVHSAEQTERRVAFERPVAKKKELIPQEQKITVSQIKARFGEQKTEDAIDFVTHYIEHVYPACRGTKHPEVSRASKAVYASRILECAEEMGCEPEFIESLTVMAAEREVEYDPMIYLVTSPYALGHWMLESGEYSYDLIRGTPYDFEGG